MNRYKIQRYNFLRDIWETIVEVHGEDDATFTLTQLATTEPYSQWRKENYGLS